MTSPADLGLDEEALAAAAGSRVALVGRPRPAGARRCSNGSASAVAERIAEIVKERMSG